MPNITGTARDLEADLAICEAATPGPWIIEGSNVICRGYTLMIVAYAGSQNDISFIAEARTGWPYAIRRAMEAEAEVDRLRHEIEILREQLEQRCARA